MTTPKSMQPPPTPTPQNDHTTDDTIEAGYIPVTIYVFFAVFLVLFLLLCAFMYIH